MATNEATAKLQRAADRINAYGAGAATYIPGAHTWGRYQEDPSKDLITIGDAMVEFQKERILARIQPDGTMTVTQNWSEPLSHCRAIIEETASEETKNAHRKITAYLEGRRPHPEVEWNVNIGPWVTGRMNGQTILQAGVPKGYGPRVIIMPDGRTAKTFTEAEKLLDRHYFPQYTPISLEIAKTKSI